MAFCNLCAAGENKYLDEVGELHLSVKYTYLWSNFFKVYFYLFILVFACLYICAPQTCQLSVRIEVGIISHVAGITDGCELLCAGN